MNTTPCYEKEDILINFRDLAVHILRRWRSVLIVTLVVALLLTGVKYLRDQRAYENALTTQKDEMAIIQLDEASLANASQVLQYQKLYQLQATYNSTSLLMQIDPGKIPTRSLSYLVTGARGFVTASMYQTHLHDLTMYQGIAEQVSPNSDPSHVMELVTATVQYDGDADAIADHAMVNIKIIAPTEEICSAIAVQVKQQMQGLKATVTDALGTHGLTLAADTTQLNADTALKTTQQNNLNNCNTLRNNLKSATDALTDKEKTYVKQMNALDKDNTSAAPTPPSVSKKMAVLGVAAGFVLMAGIYALGYVFSRKVKSREDFTERYGLFVFGNIAETAKLSLTERCLRRLFFKKDGIACAEDTAALAERQLTLSTRAAVGEKAQPCVLVIGGALNDKDAALFAPLKEATAKSGIALDTLPGALNDAAAFERLATADAIVLAETVGASSYGDIYREIEMCERLQRPILGAFILQ